MKVLLVDDETEFTSALSERLEIRDYQVRVANNGEDALHIAEADPPQIVILDLKMPGLHGLEVLKRLKQIYPEVPVLLLTGYGSTEEGIAGMQIGAYDYLMKPLNIRELIKKMEEAIHKASSKQ
jgi:DNA-binding response OmpR family regulator